MLLLDALQQHPTHAGVVQHACWALAGLAVNADNQVTFFLTTLQRAVVLR